MAETRKINDANISNQTHNQQLFKLGLYIGTFIGVCILLVAVYAIYMSDTKVAIAAFTALGIVLAIYILRSSMKP